MTWGAPLPAPYPACLGEVRVRGSYPSSSCRLRLLCLPHNEVCQKDEIPSCFLTVSLYFSVEHMGEATQAKMHLDQSSITPLWVSLRKTQWTNESWTAHAEVPVAHPQSDTELDCNSSDQHADC